MDDRVEHIHIDRDGASPYGTRALPTHMLRALSTTYPDAYVVGGAIRNLLLGQPCADWDIVVSARGHALSQSARQLANELGGFYVHLHEKADRVIVKSSDRETIIDLAPMDGPTIEADLSQRDFTINAIAIPLQVFNTWFMTTAANDFTSAIEQFLSLCIDPYHGIADSIARRLYNVSDTVFVQDPLRMLRALRLATRYQLTIDRVTIGLIQRDAHLLSGVASERIYTELVSILEPQGAAQRLYLLDNWGLLVEIFPEITAIRQRSQQSPSYQDNFKQAVETVFMLEQLAALLSNNSSLPGTQHLLSSIDASMPDIFLDASEHAELQNIGALLQEAQRQKVFELASLNKPAMKLAALLHDIGSNPGHRQADRSIIHHLLQRLHAPGPERRLIELAIVNHAYPFQLARQQVTPLAAHRYFVTLGAQGIAIALIALAAALATDNTQSHDRQWFRLLITVRLLLTGYILNRQQILPPRLLQGNELVEQLDIQPGPLIGQLLTALAEAQVDGEVHTSQEALLFAHNWLQKFH